MMRWIVGSSLKLRRVVIVVAAGMMIVGFTQLDKTPMDTLPEFMPPTVEVQTEALGLSATEVEQLITVPMEQDLLNGIAYLKTIRSESVESLSSIELIFEPGTDILRARQVVQEKMAETHALPNVSKPPMMLQPSSSTRRVMMIGLSSKKLSLIEMSVLARWTIRPRLQGVPGVANVSIWGQRERQLQVQVDPRRLHANGVGLQDVIDSTGNSLWVSPLTYLEASTPGTGGFIDTPNQRLAIQHILPVKTPADLARIVIDKGDRKTALRLGDVADVVEDHQPLIGDAVLSTGPGLLLVLEKFPGASTLEVTNAIEDALKSIQPGLADVRFDTGIYRAADYIRSSMNNLGIAMIAGAILLLLVLAGFFWNWRAALISAVSITTSMAAALLVLNLRHATVNMVVIAGLAVALAAIIDDAVMGVENIGRRLREHAQDRSAIRTVLEAAVETRGALLFATMAIALAVMPLFFFKGIGGAFLPTLASTYLLAVGLSMLVALTVTPALSMALLGDRLVDRAESPVARWLQRSSDRIVSAVAGRPGRAIVALGLIAVTGLAMLPIIRRGPVLPTFREPILLVDVDAAPGTSQPAMSRIIGKASSELRALPGISKVGAHVGRAVTGDQIVGINAAELWVAIDPKADYEGTIRSIHEVMAGYPGLDKDVLVYSNDRVKDLLTGVENDIVVRAFGEDLTIVSSKAAEIQKMLKGIKGMVSPLAELPLQEPTVEVRVDLAKAERHGIKPGDIRRTAATLLGGLEVGNLFEDNKVFEVVVWATPEVRSSVEAIRGLLIDKPDGTQVRLSDVAAVQISPVPSVIRREQVSRSIDVTANVKGRSLNAVIADVKAGLKEIDFPLEYHAELLQDPAERQADTRRLIGLAIAAAIGVLLLLQATFGSWRPALLLFLTMPVALTGGLVGAVAGDRTASLGTVGGLIAVLFVTLRNGVLLLKRYRQLEREGGADLGTGLVASGARERFVPTIMSAVATMATLLPIMALGARAGSEILNPMAFVILGGLVTSTIVTAFALPALYLTFRDEPGTRSVDDDVDLARTSFLVFEQQEAAPTGSGIAAATELPEQA